MLSPSLRTLFAAAAMLGALTAQAFAQPTSKQERTAEIDFIAIDDDITLRRMVVRNPSPKATVLFLHGFPETLHAWKDISLALADDYEVRAALTDRAGASTTLVPNVYGPLDEPLCAVTQADGRIIVALGTEEGVYYLIRMLSDGFPDPSFTRVDIGAGDFTPESMAIDEDGMLLVVGFTDQGEVRRFWP